MQQLNLFAADPPTTIAVEIAGFRLQTDYITADEERTLLDIINAQQWQTSYRRRIQQYGFGYSVTNNRKLAWVRDFPPWLIPLAERVAIDAAFGRFPENCVINEYIPPLGIGPHRDYPEFGPTVACVSLGSDIVMDFTHPERGLRVPVVVPARSFWVITGEARSAWHHGIAARLADVINGERKPRGRRVSITFRLRQA